MDEVLVEQVVQDGVQLLGHVLYQQGSPQGQTVLQVCSEVLVVQGGDLTTPTRNNDTAHDLPYLEVILCLSVLDPLLPLPLGVN